MADETQDIIIYEPKPLNIAVTVADNIRKKLGGKTPKQYKRSRPGPIDRRTNERKKLWYVPWGYVARVLNDAFGPAWSLEYDMEKDVKRIPLPDLPEVKPKGQNAGRPATAREEVMVTITLKTPFGTQTATASHTYYPNNDQILYGDVVQSAVSKALRRAATRLGAGLDLYLGDNAEEFEVNATLEAHADTFTIACKEAGIPLRSGVTLLSTKITGDPGTLDTAADVIEAAGGIETACEMLADIIAEVEALPVEPIEPDEVTTPKRGKKA